MISITSCDSLSAKRKYIRFVYNLYKDDPLFAGTAIFELKTYLFQKSNHAKEIYVDAILVSNNGKIRAVAMFFLSKKLPILQVGFFEATINAQQEVDEMLKYAEKRARSLQLEKMVIGLNGHVSVGVGMLNYLKEEKEPIAFNSIYSKLYYPEYFRNKNLKESTLTTFKGEIPVVYETILKRSIQRGNVQLRYMDKSNFQNEVFLMAEISNEALKNTELYYPIDKHDLYDRLKKLKIFLRPQDLVFVVKDGKEIGYLFTHLDYNQVVKPGKKQNKLNFAFKILTRQAKIDTLKVNSICMLEKKSTGLQLGVKTVTEHAIREGRKYLESNFIFDSNLVSGLFAKKYSYEKLNTYSIFYKKVENA